ncbi:ABC transporter permease [Empedobacter sp. UBA7248]|uniref:ABC transporter permease n=1 Tax=Empedobacter sp. UBA7248 TaxID=1946448 RepID=UPI0025C39445|nr:ABC transporter permease [Empedobacter sp. UBA7248]
MFDTDRWSEIWSSIASNKLRTALSGLTIALALFVFITLYGLGNGLQNGFQQEFFKANSLNITVNGGTTTEPYNGFKQGRAIELDVKDFNFIKHSFPDEIKSIVSTISKSDTIRNEANSGSYSITGVYPEYESMINENVTLGRFINKKDMENQSKSIVIGRLVAQDFFPNQIAIGKYLQLGSSMYQVVGVFESKDGGDNAERALYAPFTTFRTIYATDKVSSIIVTPKDGMALADISKLANAIEYNIKGRHNVAPSDYGGIWVRNAADAMEDTNQFFLILTIIVFVIGGGSLIAGIVSIGNIMVFSVKERTKEIGIRKALGATPANVLGLILQEAIMITIIFGAIGIALAALVVENIGDSLEEYFIYNPGVETNSLVMACIILFVAGTVSGLIPALNAARIKPIDALRDE